MSNLPRMMCKKRLEEALLRAALVALVASMMVLRTALIQLVALIEVVVRETRTATSGMLV